MEKIGRLRKAGSLNSNFLNLYFKLNAGNKTANFAASKEAVSSDDSNSPFVRYYQIKALADRRTQNMPVELDNRTGSERRQNSRIPQLSNDVFEIQDTFKEFITIKNNLQANINRLDNAALKKKEITKAAFSTLSPIIPFRRISSMPDNIQDGNYLRAVGLGTIALIMIPEDARDVRDGYKQIVRDKMPLYDYKNCQTEFSFFRGTALQSIVNRLGKLGVKLHELDKSLYRTKFGEIIRKTLRIEDIDEYESEKIGRSIPKIKLNKKTNTTFIDEIEVQAHRLNGISFGKHIEAALLRTPVISLLALCLLETPAIVKSVNGQDIKEKIKNSSRQMLKSFVYVFSMTAGIAIGGAYFNRKKAYAGSLFGMGLGSVIGGYVSKFAQDKIDAFGTKKK